MRVLVTSHGALGHLFAMIPVAQALQAAGHDVMNAQRCHELGVGLSYPIWLGDRAGREIGVDGLDAGRLYDMVRALLSNAIHARRARELRAETEGLPTVHDAARLIEEVA